MTASPVEEQSPPANDHRWLILFIVAIAQLGSLALGAAPGAATAVVQPDSASNTA